MDEFEQLQYADQIMQEWYGDAIEPYTEELDELEAELNDAHKC